MKKRINKALRFIFDSDVRFLALARRGLLKNMSDETFVKRFYKARTGKKLNLDQPQSFNEKLQWLKVYDHNPLYTQLVDKYEVKKIITEQLGEEYVIPTLGVWDSFDEIDFHRLPKQFVLKCTHDSGGLIICRDKNKLNLEKAKKKITKCLNTDYFSCNREWSYKNVKPRILAEAYMEADNQDSGDTPSGLVDYKFFCMNGKPEFLYVSKGLEDHSTALISFCDFSGRELPFHRSDFRPFGRDIKMPTKIDEMKAIAEKLAGFVGCPFVRVDLYSINDRIYFSEITFYPCSGVIPFEPAEWDRRLGESITLPI